MKEATMALVKCEKCGKFFGQEADETLCHTCREPNKKKAVLTGDIEHDKFTNARAIVYESPYITPKELTEELNERGVKITLQEVMKYVTDGRLTLVTVDGGTYCSGCGRKITMGTLCSDCSDKLDRFRKPHVEKEKPISKKASAKMHTKK
jgi:predicted amidophosphoribosyltransferase